MRWSREMTNSRDSEVPRPEHRVPDRQSLSTLSPNTSQRFQQRQEAAFRHSHTAQLSLPSSHSRAPAQQPLPRSLCSRGSFTRPRTAKEPVPLTLSVAHSRGALTPTVFLLTLWDFSVTHTGSPLHSLPRSFLFHTQTPSHLESCTLTKPSRVSLTHTRTHAPARSLARWLRVRLPHTTVHSGLHAPGVLLSAAASLPRPPPHAVSGPHPARGDGGRAERSTAHETSRTETEPAPGRTGASPSPPRPRQLAPGAPALPGCSVAPPPLPLKPRPRHVTRTGSRQRAPPGDPARSGGPQAALLPGTRARRGPRRSAGRAGGPHGL